MKRRQVLQQALQASGGMIAANLLGGCNQQSLVTLFPLALQTPESKLPEHLITPLSEFYVQSYALPSRIKLEDWRLKISGAVAKPLTLAFDDILAAPQEDFNLTMECIGNPTGGNLIGNARWRGTPLLPFLEQAGINPEATEFRLHGADWYETTLPIAKVMRPGVRLVHQMNGAPLTPAHGYPLRIIVPGHFGQKQPKWLVNIEASPTSKQGFWERQGWSNTAEIPTHGLIRQVQENRVWNKRYQVRFNRQGDQGWQRGILVAGVALDKASPIQNIRISTNGGQTWEQGEQNHPASSHEWTLWRHLWQPTEPGNYTLMAQAVSDRDQQPSKDTHPKDGSAGTLQIQVTLAA